ncbi:aminoacyl-tRNA hydrolase [Agarilytica rhodophyticola]|uniref:aminoacyl-tRNA hydrolase n=1 Tax=Agarilytica rhodophyticola TaxID=1737490 RepID=UPI000B341B14|nr:aminoacyl-tRNA hydrolase [Agarilytica rhodophyticola]
MKTPDTPVKLIVGLGNPGSEYQNTRHNAGQDFVAEIARQYSGSMSPSPKFFGLDTRITIAHRDVRLLIPTTFMNLSGKAVAAISQFYKIPTESILVAHDELDLDPGVVRLKIGGGHGGHNGLRDIISAQGNNKNFGRLRLGIGHPGNAKQVSNYVLKRAPSDEMTRTENAMGEVFPLLPDLVAGNWEKAMRELHSNNSK